MEEVDSIILHFLHQLNIEIGENVKNLSDLTEEIIIESASKCLNAIDHKHRAPSKLPSGLSQRIEVAAQIASMCKDLGYKNDVGYQTFLYHNENELRQVFMFLIEKLPNEEKKPSKEKTTNKKHLFLQEIANKIGEELNTIWIPPCCNAQKSNDNFAKWNYDQEFLKNYSEDIIQKLREVNEITKPTETKEENKNIITNNIKENEVNIENTKTLKELKENSILLRQKLDLLESERNVMDMEFSQVHKSCEYAEADLNNIQNILRSIGIEDIDSESVADTLLEEVNKNIHSLHRKSEALTSKNLSLKLEIEKLKTQKSLTDSDRTKCKKILINLKETAKSLREECEKKEELKNQVKVKYERLKGGNKRHIYTKRILEIIGNVDKQNSEIKKILEDTRQIQKEINTLEGQLERCFSIADETLFKDAKKDDQAKKAYKLLALLHSECNTIVSLVNETGVLSRDLIDLEDNIKAEKLKRTEDVLEKIKLDLKQLQNEDRN